MKTKMLLACVSACAMARAEFSCALVDPLEWIYPDSAVSAVKPFAETDVPLGGVADVNVLFNGLEPGKPVSVSADRAGGEWLRCVEVSVERNTGLHGFTCKPGETNTWSVRLAPYWAYEALAPLAGGAFTPKGATAAVRFRMKDFPAKPGAYDVRFAFAQGSQTVRRSFRVNVHGVRLPDVGRGSFKYTNWFNLNEMATRHGLEHWSDAHFEMIGRYARLAAQGRQNCAWIPLGYVFDVQDGTPVLNEERLARIVDVYTAAGIWWIEGGHVCHFNGTWGAKNFLPQFSTNVTTTAAGAADIARIAAPLAAAIERHGWKDRWIQHVADEPDVVNAAEFRETCATVRRYMPGVKTLDAVESCAVAGALDMLCPKVNTWQNDRAAFDFQRTNCHDAVWCYTCCVPGGHWLNRTLDCHLLKPLYVFWGCSEFGLSGFLHWGYNMYQNGCDPFGHSTVDNWGTNGGKTLPPGDTHVVFPGTDGPWSGARFEATRQGVEDYELLEMLRRRDAAKCAALTRRLFRAFDDYTLDVPLYRATRREILALVAAGCSSPSGGNSPKPSRALELPHSAENPRNSEGDFALLKNGDVLFVYSHYVKGKGEDNDPAVLASRVSHDGGKTWSKTSETVVANEGGLNVMSVSFLRLKDGSLALFYLRKNSWNDCRPVMRVSRDEGNTWSDAKTCVPDADCDYYVLNNCRVVRLKSGRIVLPMCQHTTPKGGKIDGAGRLVCYYSDDDGATWTRSACFETYDDKGKRVTTQEPGVIELKDGRALMYARTGHGRHWFCWSSDGCATFTKAVPGNLYGPCGPATIVRLSTGDLLAVWNDHEFVPSLRKEDNGWGRRVPLTLAISRDEGKTWTHRHTLEGNLEDWFCYFSVLEVDGNVLLGYCAKAGLRHARITTVPVKWLYAEDAQSEQPLPGKDVPRGFFQD